MGGFLPWLAAGVIMGGILHILTVLGLPYIAEKDAWSRLSGFERNKLMLADDSEVAALPFSAPDVVHAYCVFDLSARNLVVTTPMLDATWSVAVSTPQAENFYLITGADAKRNDIRLLVVARERLAQEESTERSEEGEEQNIVVSPALQGIVAIRAPLRGESFRRRTIEALKQARCEEQKPFEAAVAAAEEAERQAGESGVTPLSRRR